MPEINKDVYVNMLYRSFYMPIDKVVRRQDPEFIPFRTIYGEQKFDREYRDNSQDLKGRYL